MYGAFIGPNVKISKNYIINNFAQIERGSIIGDHCHISTSVTINGTITIGNASFVGIKLTLREGLKIKKIILLKWEVFLKINHIKIHQKFIIKKYNNKEL